MKSVDYVSVNTHRVRRMGIKSSGTVESGKIPRTMPLQVKDSLMGELGVRDLLLDTRKQACGSAFALGLQLCNGFASSGLASRNMRTRR